MNMQQWLEETPKQKKALPILSFPGVQIINKTVNELVHNGALQADCMGAIAARYDTLAAVSLMDLSVEAEAFGSPVKYDDNEVPTVTAAIINTLEDAEAIVAPKVGAGRTNEYIKTIELAAKAITDRPVIAGSIGPFSLAGRLMDMTEIMIKCTTDPDEVHIVLEKVTDFLIDYNKALKAAGAKGILIAEPAAGLLSPRFMGEFSSPYVKRIIEALKDETCAIIYHNCGNATLQLVDEMLATGAKMFSFGNAIDLEEMLKIIPADKIVMGNLDPSSVFRHGSVEDVVRESNKLLAACSKYPNFVVSSGCDIPPMTPLENIDAFFATVKEFYR